MADDGWVRIPPPTSRQLLAVGSIWFVVTVYLAWRPLGLLGGWLDERIGGGWFTVVLTVVVGLAALSALVLLVMARMTPGLDIHVERRILRLRGRERQFADLVAARIEQPQDPPPSRYDPPPKRPRRDPLVLRLDLRERGRFRLVLAVGATSALSAEQTEALVQAVRGSRIVAPTASYDPEGRFTHLNFPGRLDIDAAVRLIEDPQAARSRPR